MTAGLPGAGIGGLFYLASALFMPVRSLVLTARGRGAEARWPLALRQSSIAAGVLLALWGTGRTLEAMMLGARVQPSGGIAGSVMAGAPARALGPYALAISIGTLVAVLLAVQVARALLAAPRVVPPARAESRRDDGRSAA
jgi:hypothetical protein